MCMYMHIYVYVHVYIYIYIIGAYYWWKMCFHVCTVFVSFGSYVPLRLADLCNHCPQQDKSSLLC